MTPLVRAATVWLALVPTSAAWAYDVDGDGFDELIDCNDGNNQIYPGAPETIADGIDQDCSGGDTCYADGDLDGFGGTGTTVSADLDCTDPGEATDTPDCDDTRATVYPGAPEIVANGRDDDCDGTELCWTDGDLDGWGVPTENTSLDLDCTDPGESAFDSDCDDADAGRSPGTPEVYADGIDQDCFSGDRCWVDADNDGHSSEFGFIDSADSDCTDGAERTVPGEDCNDDDPLQNPDAVETVADEIDMDCDGTELCWADVDRDGWGDAVTVLSTNENCNQPGEAELTGDCNDLDDGVNPGESETPGDGIDQDCDGVELCWLDGDGDGYGVDTSIVSGDGDCLDAGESLFDTDCADTDPLTYPGAPEIPFDGIDQDCTGRDLTGCYRDEDGDGVGDREVNDFDGDGCMDADESLVGGDCDDTDPTIAPGIPETIADGVDSDCDGFERCLADADGDGFGGANEVLSADEDCTDPGEAALTEDCLDFDSTVYPGAPDVCGDGIDSDCDGSGGQDDDEDGDGLGWLDEALEATDPCGVDTDGDGLSDGDEVAIGTEPLFVDTDGDGLTDAEETPDPLNPPDTDGDGLIDAVDPDDDDDGIPTALESTTDDPDGDGLPNHLDPDSDDGGTSDGDELAMGTDPYDPDDDIPVDPTEPTTPGTTTTPPGTTPPTETDTPPDDVPPAVTPAESTQPVQLACQTGPAAAAWWVAALLALGRRRC